MPSNAFLHGRGAAASGKPIPPPYMPAPPSATDAQRMIHALEFIAERMAGIEARIAQLVDLQDPHHSSRY